jgi:hypothetical protein
VSGPVHPTTLNVLYKFLLELTSSQLGNAGRLSYITKDKLIQQGISASTKW